MRSQVENGQLRGCPTCGTKVDETQLRLRDFSWVNEVLPGKVGGMDLDFCLSNARTGKTLFIEMKPTGGAVSMGARLTFKTLISKGDVDVWVVWGPAEDGTVEMARVMADGNITSKVRLPLAELAGTVAQWWEAAAVRPGEDGVS